MKQEDAIQHAVEESIAEVKQYSPADPKNQVGVIVDMATLKFNQFEDMTGRDFGIESSHELTVKCEVEAEKQLGLR